MEKKRKKEKKEERKEEEKSGEAERGGLTLSPHTHTHTPRRRRVREAARVAGATGGHLAATRCQRGMSCAKEEKGVWWSSTPLLAFSHTHTHTGIGRRRRRRGRRRPADAARSFPISVVA